MRIRYYLRYIRWLPVALIKEFAYRFWTGEKSNKIKLGPHMTKDEHDKWFS